MKNESLGGLNFVNNLLVFALLLYMIKTVLGIDLVANCHAEQVITNTCQTARVQKK